MTILVRTMFQATDLYGLGCVLLKECALSNTFVRWSLEHLRFVCLLSVAVVRQRLSLVLYQRDTR